MAVAEVDLEMDDLFGEGRDGEELLDQPAEQRELDDEAQEVPGPGEGQAQEGEGDVEVLNRLRDLSKGAAKKRVLKPQPKLDATRLQSDRGLPALTKTFEGVKFKGKGHEKEDLLKMMSTLEHWAHRLFPKASFDDFIERLEKLGSKKGVQTTMKRVRMDMPILNEDFVVNNEAEAVTEPADGNDGNDHNDDTIPEFDAEEVYEEMIRQERKEQERQKATQQGNDEYNPFHSATPSPVRNHITTETPRTPSATGATPSAGGSKSLTAEQQERIERNKRLAMEKRMNKMGITPGKSPASASVPNQSSQPKTSVSDDSHNGPSLGSQRPDNSKLADEMLRDLDEETNKNIPSEDIVAKSD